MREDAAKAKGVTVGVMLDLVSEDVVGAKLNAIFDQRRECLQICLESKSAQQTAVKYKLKVYTWMHRMDLKRYTVAYVRLGPFVLLEPRKHTYTIHHTSRR